MYLAVIIATLVIFFSGVPMWAAFGILPAIVLVFVLGVAPSTLANIAFARIDIYIFLAMPFFLLASNLILVSGALKRAIAFFDAWTGHLPGGLAVVVVLFCTFFAAITGSAMAAVIAIGLLLYPEMLNKGYSRSFSSGLIVMASLLGPIIPPSGTMIIMCMLMEISVGTLFACGMVPGLIMAACLIVVSVIYCKRHHYPVKEAASWKTRGITTGKATPFLTLPIVVLGGIYGGFFTPTEGATVACIMAIANGLIFRGFTRQNVWDAGLKSAKFTCNILMLMVGIQMFSHLLHLSGMPVLLMETVLALEISPVVFVLLTTLVFFALGFLIPPWATFMMCCPLLMPALLGLGLNLYWFGIIYTIDVIVGGVTPPFAYNIFVACQILDTPFSEVVAGMWRNLPIYFGMMMLIIFVPDVALWLPRLMGLRGV